MCRMLITPGLLIRSLKLRKSLENYYQESGRSGELLMCCFLRSRLRSQARWSQRLQRLTCTPSCMQAGTGNRRAAS